MKLKEILDRTTVFFKEKNFDTPRLDAELLLAHGLKLERIQLYLKYDQPINENELVSLRDLVRRRALGEPIAYIFGYKDFYRNRFDVSPDVLIPRPETEHLVDEALLWAEDRNKNWGILDLGCGSGCIGLSLLKELPNSKLIAVDVSARALEVAKQNATRLGLADRVQFVLVDATESAVVMQKYLDFVGQNEVDILVSNPPYIDLQDINIQENVKKFEPHLALFSNESGMGLLKEWSRKYSDHIRSPGLMLLEVGASQGEPMKLHLEDLSKFNKINIIKDLSGHDRVIRGEING
jgi:release factor glutamine methyltransferase